MGGGVWNLMKLPNWVSHNQCMKWFVWLGNMWVFLDKVYLQSVIFANVLQVFYSQFVWLDLIYYSDMVLQFIDYHLAGMSSRKNNDFSYEEAHLKCVFI